MKSTDKIKKIIYNVKNVVKERKFKYISFFWIIIAIQFVIGNNLQNKGHSIRNMTDFTISLVQVIGLSLIFIVIHYCTLEIYKKIKKRLNKEKINANIENKNENSEKKWFIYFFIIIICWIPTLLAFYPGLVNYDGGYQIRDYFFDNKINLGHPIVTTFFYTIFYEIGFYYLNSPALGMLMFSIFQMTIMALIFSYAVKFIEEETGKKCLRNISILIYGLFPYNQLFTIMTTKDVIFAGLVTIFIINLYKMLKGKYKIVDYIFFIIITILMLLFRSNAVYALIVLLPFAFLMLINNKKKFRNLLVVAIISIIICQGINRLVVSIVNDKSGENIIWLCVFAQATGKITKERENDLTDYERKKISLYFTNYKEVGKIYKTYIADYTMKLAKYDNILENRKEFFTFMLELAKKYPREFMDSYLNTMRGYWYVLDNSFCLIHNDYDSDKFGALELFCFKVGKGQYEIVENSKLPALQKLYKDMFCRNMYQKIYGVRIIFQPATYLYILFGCILYSIYKRHKTRLLIEMFLLLYAMTFVTAPCALIRYVYPIIVNIPIIFSLLKIEERK